MSRTCTICKDQLRPMIEASYAQGDTIAEIARRTNFGEDAIRRHVKRHLTPLPSDSEGLDQQLSVWLARLNGLFTAAAAAGDLRTQIESAKTAMNLLAEKQRLADEKAKKNADAESDGRPSLAWIDQFVRAGNAGQPTDSGPLLAELQRVCTGPLGS